MEEARGDVSGPVRMIRTDPNMEHLGVLRIRESIVRERELSGSPRVPSSKDPGRLADVRLHSTARAVAREREHPPSEAGRKEWPWLATTHSAETGRCGRLWSAARINSL